MRSASWVRNSVNTKDTKDTKANTRVRRSNTARHYSPRTEEAYVHWIRRYIVFHGKKHPSALGAPDISAFLTWLAIER